MKYLAALLVMWPLVTPPRKPSIQEIGKMRKSHKPPLRWWLGVVVGAGLMFVFWNVAWGGECGIDKFVEDFRDRHPENLVREIKRQKMQAAEGVYITEVTLSECYGTGGSGAVWTPFFDTNECWIRGTTMFLRSSPHC